MKLYALCLLLSGLVLGFTTPTPQPEPMRRLIVIALDGARPDALLQAATPHIKTLAQTGASAWEAQTIFPPATLPAHASLLTGLDVADHGVDWNGTNIGCLPIESPTFITEAAAAGYRTAMVVGKEVFCHLHQSDAVDYSFARAGDRSVVDRAIELLDADYEVLFVHLPNPDYFGHSTNWMSTTYLNELANTDRQVGRILSALETTSTDTHTWVIITADHGGHEDRHGQNIPADMNIPWLIWGSGVQVNIALDHPADTPINIADTAATARWLLNLPQADHSLGQPVCAAFTAEMLEKRPCPQYSNHSEVE